MWAKGREGEWTGVDATHSFFLLVSSCDYESQSLIVAATFAQWRITDFMSK